MTTPKFSVVMPVMLPREDPWRQWMIELTGFVVAQMRHGAGEPIELVVPGKHADVHDVDWSFDATLVSCDDRSSYVEDFNNGCDVAKGEYIIHTANDIIVTPGWLDGLAAPFIEFADCGVSTIAVGEPGAWVGGRGDDPTFIEAMYGPLMMFRSHRRLDDGYVAMHSDSDLVMQVYQEGLRAYRYNGAFAFHLNNLTWQHAHDDGSNERNRETGNRRFAEKWGNSPLWMAKMILNGAIVYGHEQHRVHGAKA